MDMSIYDYYHPTDVYVVVDIETDLIQKDRSIADQKRSILMLGTKPIDGGPNGISYSPDDLEIVNQTYGDFLNHTVLIGHNISYDIIQMCKNSETFYKYFKEFKIKLYDTAYVTYSDSGQTLKYPSLEAACEFYKIPMSKENTVSEMISNGICPSVIMKSNPGLLEAYLTQDLNMTFKLFDAQTKGLRSSQNLHMLNERMAFMHNTILMSLQGIPFDREKCKDELRTNSHLLDKIRADLTYEIAVRLKPLPSVSDPVDIYYPREQFSPSSRKALQAVIYGGTFTGEYTYKDGMYKTGLRAGQDKIRTAKYELKVKGYVESIFDALGGSVDSKVIKDLLKVYPSDMFLINLLDWRELDKSVGTYLFPYAELSEGTNRIHCDYNHTSTSTSRISASKPNLQNVQGD